jgi:ankyrin repeat protein
MFNKEALLNTTNTLIHCITSRDFALLRSLLFFPRLDRDPLTASVYPPSRPLLVNFPDADGWSPIHYCVATPLASIEILDALYCAGADLVLFTTREQYTPLHCLAQFGKPENTSQEAVHRLYQFVSHLIEDLRAPLASRSKEEETPLHIAAEHGSSIEVLMILIELDKTGAVREMRNRRGYVT